MATELDRGSDLSMSDSVNNPRHYTSHPSGVECIEITEHLCFNLGNAVKYCFRSGNKVRSEEIQDLQKGIWYAEREMESFPERYKVRSKHTWKVSIDRVGENQGPSSDQEWIYDLYVFFTHKVAVCACDGVRDVCWSAPLTNGRVSFRRQPREQLFEQFGLGVNERQSQEKKTPQNRAFGSRKVVVETDNGAGDADQNKSRIAVSLIKNLQCFKSTDTSDQIWQKLAAFIHHETNVNKAAAIFYLVVNNQDIHRLCKARGYIDREIARLVGKREVKVHERIKENDLWKTQTNDQA